MISVRQAAALGLAVTLLVSVRNAAGFDSHESTWLGARPDLHSPAAPPLRRPDIERMRRGFHDNPPRPLTAEERKLHDAAARGDVKGLKEAIDAGANTSSRDEFGDSALAIAVRHSHFDAVNLLLANHAWPSGKSAKGLTPLAMASIRGHAPMVKVLLRAGARVDERSDNRNTALALAIGQGHPGVVRELAEHGADLTIPDRDGFLPLGAAAFEGRTEMVRILLDHGADPNIMGKDLKTPLLLALLGGHRENVELLLARGGDRNLVPAPICAFVFEPPLSVCP